MYPSKKERHGARGARKVKTGCLTCKIRHKKCDETRPACSQCTSTGRKCDLLAKSEDSMRPIRRPNAELWSLASEPCCVSAPFHVVDVWHFEYFRVVWAKAISRCLGNGSWEDLMVRAALTEPYIFHGALALGALSRNTIPSSIRGRPTFSPGFSGNYSLNKYNLSIQELNKYLADSTLSWEMAVLGSLILIAIESVLGNYDKAQMHLRGALAIFNSQDRYNNVNSQMRESIGLVLGAVSQMNARLLCLTKQHSIMPLQFLTLPAAFANISEARDTLNLITAAMNSLLWRRIAERKTSTHLPLSTGLVQNHSTLIYQLESWRALLSKFTADHFMDAKTSTCVKILLIHYEVTRISASTHFSSTESLYDVYMSNFSYIVNLATEVLAAEHLTSTTTIQSNCDYSFDIALAQPLFFTATKCRDSTLRRKAIEMMEKIGGTSSDDARILVGAARWILTTEENLSLREAMVPAVVKEEERLHEIRLSIGSAAGTCKITAWKRRVDGSWYEVNTVLHIGTTVGN